MCASTHGMSNFRPSNLPFLKESYVGGDSNPVVDLGLLGSLFHLNKPVTHSGVQQPSGMSKKPYIGTEKLTFSPRKKLEQVPYTNDGSHVFCSQPRLADRKTRGSDLNKRKYSHLHPPHHTLRAAQEKPAGMEDGGGRSGNGVLTSLLSVRPDSLNRIRWRRWVTATHYSGAPGQRQSNAYTGVAYAIRNDTVESSPCLPQCINDFRMNQNQPLRETSSPQASAPTLPQ
ncbi:unnamed protein product [Schistocephalus solidus]|uniref:Mediator of RNA polymerase II transcription subunit 19 n=1 Tax=Schistocephalus solidus TaxID=70667 RepID=A0A183SX15_SCHSO|nr:unnamed protein product [Schistocephalus solidus]